MNNQEILRKIVNYIENVMKEKSLTSRDLADICVKKTGKMSPRTIDNMFKTPSSTTLSTLLKVCEGLDLNLNAVFHSIEIAKTSAEKRTTEIHLRHRSSSLQWLHRKLPCILSSNVCLSRRSRRSNLGSWNTSARRFQFYA